MRDSSGGSLCYAVVARLDGYLGDENVVYHSALRRIVLAVGTGYGACFPTREAMERWQ